MWGIGHHDLDTLSQRLRRSTVHVRGRGPGGGSGVIWDASGLVITNAHVVRGPEAEVELFDGRRLEAAVTGLDRGRDLAALRITADDLPAASIGDSDTLRVGELVIAVGNPLGLTGAVTSGIIHTIDPRGRFVQADVHLAPGNSGGPLATARGDVIGINSMVSGGLGLAVPSNVVSAFLSQGSPRPHLGLSVRTVVLPSGPGLLVLQVANASPSQEAGLLMGDVLIGIGEENIRSPRELASILDAIPSGAPIAFRLLRAGRPEKVTVHVHIAEAA